MVFVIGIVVGVVLDRWGWPLVVRIVGGKKPAQ